MKTSDEPEGAAPRRSVRALGGELWDELMAREIEGVDWRGKSAVVDLMMGVLARHFGAVIDDDDDLPVNPLPLRAPPKPPGT
jgi:hypothetical protein